MTPLWLLLVVLGVSTTMASSTASATDQRTEGWCSPAVAHTGGNVTITCEGVHPKALQRLNELLDQRDLQLQGKIREAEERSRRYQQLSQVLAMEAPDGAPARKAKALLEEGKLAEADELLFSEAYNRVGQYRKHKDYTKAVANYQQALQINPGHFGAYYNLADTYQKMGHLEAALQHFESASKLSPNDARTAYNIAKLYQQKGEANKAKEYYKKVIGVESRDSDLRHRARQNLQVLGE
jgi:tetratricopeptide (TPR) repeat protein